jgi:hypothetical protein
MLHIHFGTGRLGLGLVAPFFRSRSSELHLVNRGVAGLKPTGETSIGSERRNQLLGLRNSYLIRPPGKPSFVPREVEYEGFHAYQDEGPEPALASILSASKGKQQGVVVTASLVHAANYGPVIRVLNHLSALKESGEPLGRIFLIACENGLNAHEVLSDSSHAGLITPEARKHVTPVRALVDRLCVGMEEAETRAGPALAVLTEQYGSLKLDLRPETEDLRELCDGSQVEFSRHVDVEAKIKSWLLNGTHWLIALSAFQASGGSQDLKLNEYLAASEENKAFAMEVMQEMKEGAAIALRDPRYKAFARDYDVDHYLEGAATAILRRFFETEDSITRILARFQAPTPKAVATIETFSKRFEDRVGEPISAYEKERGRAPPAASHSLFSLLRLVASGTFIERRAN